MCTRLLKVKQKGVNQILDQESKYFVQVNVDGSCFAYYRQRYENNGLYEEIWQQKYKSWKHIPGRLIWMQISGECTLAQVSFEQFRQLLPEAFEDEEGNK
jgi:hypothetical protein